MLGVTKNVDWNQATGWDCMGLEIVNLVQFAYCGTLWRDGQSKAEDRGDTTCIARDI